MTPSLHSENALSPSSAQLPALTTQQVLKRDGSTASFDARRIITAIAKAGAATGEFGPSVAERLGLKVQAMLSMQEGQAYEVERIQDIVEEVLLASPYRASAKAYIIYRDQHSRLRELTTAARADLLDAYLAKLDWQVNENANMAYSLQGLNNYLASEVSKTYWLNRVYPAEIREAHSGGDFHIHDLGQLSVYCVGWDLADLLEQGFRGAPGKSESRPAKHFRAALGQIVNFFYTLQGEAAGAQAFSSVDTYLAPFIRADGLDPVEVRQALQEFVFNLNVPTRVGFQTPFTNVTLDLEVPSQMRDEPVILGGKRLEDSRYGDYQYEMDLFNQAFFEVMAEGDAKGRVFTFPIPTINIGPDFNFTDPRHDKLWEVTARYGIPYFANFVNSDLSPEDARSMCCRLRLDTRKLDKRGGGLFGANPLTGSIGVVTMNLPRLGHTCASEDEFIERLLALMDLAKDSLEIKRKTLERLTDARLYPYSSYYLSSIKERRGQWWHNHFSTIGLVGLNEAAVNLMGVDIAEERGRTFGLRVLDAMRERLADYQEETGHFYNLEATPAEGTSYRLARLDAEHHHGIHFAHPDSAEPYYSNSSQLPVQHTEDVIELLDHQDAFQSRYTGGTVQHIYLGEAVADPAAVREFVRMVTHEYRLPYVSVTPTFSVCPEHGYQSGRHHSCPHCGRESEVYSRVVGYLRPVEQWNRGKQAEFGVRATFDAGMYPAI
ncbi:MAG: ribonucleoside triphosphate reductase [Planctomycetota bacterium]|nr:MAG: ribonucleoside triphosphate reductase [Planctomycetota bacterium]